MREAVSAAGRLTIGRRLGPRARMVLVAAALLVPLATGVLVHRDYGLPWDEPFQRTLGRQAFRYAFEGNPAYLENADRYYGVAFEMTLFAAERVLGFEGGDPREVFFLRHLVEFLAFWAASVCLFDLVRRHLGSRALGLVAAGLLFASPRLFADAFYNTKDLAFLSFFAVAVWTLDRYVARPGPVRAAIHGLACAYATDIRLAGLLLFPLTAFALAIVEAERGRTGRARRLWSLVPFGAVAGLAAVALWPFLWSDPVGHFLESLRRMAHYPWDGEVLFAGQVVRASRLPWSYLPVWIAVTTPLALLPFAAAGLAAAGLSFRPRHCLAAAQKARLAVVLVWLVAPAALVILLRSVLYDGWRQLYFVYPALVFLATIGVDLSLRALSSGGARAAAAGVALAALAGGTVSTVAWMVRWHPHQNVFFNAAAGTSEQVATRFDVDYWGLGCRRLLEDLAAADPRPRIAILTSPGPCSMNVRMLKAVDRDRFVRVSDPAQADYVVEHYRRLVPPPPEEGVVLSVSVDGLLLASARRGDRARPTPP